jgi:hypothetical protein
MLLHLSLLSLALLYAPTADAAPLGEKVQKQRLKGNIAKAEKICDEHIKAGTVRNDRLAMELCANMKLTTLKESSATEQQITAFATYWTGTKSRAEAIGRLWALTSTRRNINEVGRFYKLWPDSPEAQSARRMEQELAFEKASSSNTESEWSSFINAYPTHSRIVEAKGQWHAVAFKEAELADTIASWDALISKCPNHPRKAEIHERKKAVVEREINAEFERAFQSTDPSALTIVSQRFPEDIRSAYLRSVHTKGQLPTSSMHSHFPQVRESLEMLTVHPAQRILILEVPHTAVADVDLVVINKGGQEIQPFHEAWESLRTAEGIDAAFEIKDIGGEWKKSVQSPGTIVAFALPWPLCKPTNPDQTYAIAIKQRRQPSGTLFSPPIQPTLECSGLGKGIAPAGPGAFVKQLDPSQIDTTSPQPRGKAPPSGKRSSKYLKLTKPVSILGFMCKDKLVLGHASGPRNTLVQYNVERPSDTQYTWSCISSGNNEGWNRSFRDGELANFFYGGLVNYSHTPKRSVRVGSVSCSSTENHPTGSVRKCMIAAPVTVDGIRFQLVGNTELYFDDSGNLAGARTHMENMTIGGRVYSPGYFRFDDGVVTDYQIFECAECDL